jgi:hypothetical protein
MKHGKLLPVTIGAIALLGACVGSACARNLSFSSQTFRVAFRNIIFSGNFGEVNCAVTLEGSLHTRSMPKVAGSLVGYITRANLGFCSIGTATILRETLPWHVRYSSFEPRLPEIKSLTVQTETRFKIREPFGLTCLFASTPENPATLRFHRDPVTQQLTEANRGGTIPSGPECFGSLGELRSGNEPVTVLNSTARISVTLI